MVNCNPFLLPRIGRRTKNRIANYLTKMAYSKLTLFRTFLPPVAFDYYMQINLEPWEMVMSMALLLWLWEMEMPMAHWPSMIIDIGSCGWQDSAEFCSYNAGAGSRKCHSNLFTSFFEKMGSVISGILFLPVTVFSLFLAPLFHAPFCLLFCFCSSIAFYSLLGPAFSCTSS